MLEELRLRNFRCFEDHRVTFKPVTVIVGQNNAGKSTIVEALRLVSIVENRYQALNFSDVPQWLEIPLRHRGVRPSLKGFEINLKSIFHRYGDPPAIIEAQFRSGAQIAIYVGNDGEVHAVIHSAAGKPVTTKGQARNITLPNVSILPQVGPVAREEVILNPDYVRRAQSSNLAPLHFRNQLNLFYHHFERFKGIAESTWPSLKLNELQGQGGLPEQPLSLLLRDGNFSAEVAWMGHGLQMWLQTMWFLARCDAGDSVILDEPDVYMHADLQRKLIRLLRGRYQQAIIATHSVEIMSEVEPDEILVVDRRKHHSSFATSLPTVQLVVNQIGGVHNLQLARLWTCQKCLLLEGKDLALLKIFQQRLFPETKEPFGSLPNASVGGWGGWNYAVGSKLILTNAVDEKITTYCILDSDYHTPEEIESRLADAQRRGVELHIWRRKEIENYLLVPSAIARVIVDCAQHGVTPPSTADVERQLEVIADGLRDSIFDAFAQEYFVQDRGGGTPKANQRARERMARRWNTRKTKIETLSGKVAIAQLSNWSKRVYDVSFGAQRIAQALTTDEIDAELATVISAIEERGAFPHQECSSAR